jgi:ribosomal protein S18 acetylase RimI-like enzyme
MHGLNMNGTSPQGTVIHLPKRADIPDTVMTEIVKRYKHIRLMGLQLSPSAFGSNYAREAAFTDDIWVRRITNPLGKMFVAIRLDDLSDAYGNDGNRALTILLNSPWKGVITILGPQVLPPDRPGLEHAPWKIFTPDNSSDPPQLVSMKNGHTVYVIVGMYVSPNGRREGHGRHLVDAAVAAAVEESRDLKASKISICLEVSQGNIPAKKLYEHSGFSTRDGSGEMDENMVWQRTF